MKEAAAAYRTSGRRVQTIKKIAGSVPIRLS